MTETDKIKSDQDDYITVTLKISEMQMHLSTDNTRELKPDPQSKISANTSNKSTVGSVFDLLNPEDCKSSDSEEDE